MKVSIGKYPKKGGDRKISVQIDPHDTWSMDTTLAHIIYPMLIQLKATKHGSPTVADDGVPDHLKSTAARELSAIEIESGHVDDDHHARWDWVLDEMIWAFGQHITDWESQYYSGEVDWQFGENGEVLEGPKHSFDVDMDKYQAHMKRMHNGFRLFGTYYTSLWD